MEKKLYDVVTVDGRTRVTEDHSLMVGGLETKPTQLVPGMVVDTGDPGPGLAEAGISCEMAWALGLFLAEGSVSYSAKNQNTLARIANSSLELLGRAQRTFSEWFSERCSVHDSGSGTTQLQVWSLRIGDAATDFVSRYCYSIHNEHFWDRSAKRNARRLVRYKKVPIQVLNGSREIKEAFIEGYMRGDGFRDQYTWKSDSKDLVLVAGLQYLYRELGWETRISVRDDKPNITVLRRVKNGRGVPGEVRRVRALGKTDAYVYDLETESHTFVAGVGMLVHHNTGLGQGVTARLRELQAEGKLPPFVGESAEDRRGLTIVPVNFGSSSEDPTFDRAKDELWWKLREAIRNTKLGLPPDREVAKYGLPKGNDMVAQLTTPIYDSNSAGKIVVYDKRTSGARGSEDAKARIRNLPAKSPDVGHAIAMAAFGASQLQAGTSPIPAKTTQEIHEREVAKLIKASERQGDEPRPFDPLAAMYGAGDDSEWDPF